MNPVLKLWGCRSQVWMILPLVICGNVRCMLCNIYNAQCSKQQNQLPCPKSSLSEVRKPTANSSHKSRWSSKLQVVLSGSSFYFRRIAIIFKVGIVSSQFSSQIETMDKTDQYRSFVREISPAGCEGVRDPRIKLCDWVLELGMISNWITSWMTEKESF